MTKIQQTCPVGGKWAHSKTRTSHEGQPQSPESVRTLKKRLCVNNMTKTEAFFTLVPAGAQGGKGSRIFKVVPPCVWPRGGKGMVQVRGGMWGWRKVCWEEGKCDVAEGSLADFPDCPGATHYQFPWEQILICVKLLHFPPTYLAVTTPSFKVHLTQTNLSSMKSYLLLTLIHS
jgi:hypothetical protein